MIGKKTHPLLACMTPMNAVRNLKTPLGTNQTNGHCYGCGSCRQSQNNSESARCNCRRSSCTTESSELLYGSNNSCKEVYCKESQLWLSARLYSVHQRQNLLATDSMHSSSSLLAAGQLPGQTAVACRHTQPCRLRHSSELFLDVDDRSAFKPVLY